MALSTPGTVFEANVSRLILLMNSQRGLSDDANQKIDEAKSRILAPHATAQSLLTAINEATPMVAQFQTSINNRLFSAPWLIVILVTFAEAYLQDAFSLIIKGSFKNGTLPDVVAEEVSAKWVKETIRSGGPSQWITKLTKFGATGFEADQGTRMQKIWDLRNKIVHTAEPVIEGNPYSVLKDALSLIGKFVMTADALVVSKSS